MTYYFAQSTLHGLRSSHSTCMSKWRPAVRMWPLGPWNFQNKQCLRPQSSQFMNRINRKICYQGFWVKLCGYFDVGASRVLTVSFATSVRRTAAQAGGWRHWWQQHGVLTEKFSPSCLQRTNRWRTQEFFSGGGGGQQNQLRAENGDLGAVTPLSGVLEAAVIWYKKLHFI
jgi:hypothetical protein